MHVIKGRKHTRFKNEHELLFFSGTRQPINNKFELITFSQPAWYKLPYY